ncbi:MAG TPA: Crp/Fnr family transcriptional regulator [Polaromonas sp.]|uniref:Crp/Fnr family transcriptional regulator n=1 Tax=Polaromonas sp. TaxID=1869339 RepID=UPI002D24333F|nr:Crp/Fnr family transcriptional regulator [Polaromonas sp.]HYW57808.1 Crp/Fnr family transcriptional regulator [Polaromonas sp.]
MPDLSSWLPVLHTGRWFSQLPLALSDGLLAMATVRHLATGEALFLRGNPPCGLYALVKGSVRISGLGGRQGEAREAVLTLLEPPNWFGEISVFDGSPRTHDAHAAEPSTLLQLPQPSLTAWLAQHPEHWRELGLLMSDKLRIAFVAMEELALLPAPQRLARRLVKMAEGYGQWRESQQSRRVIDVSQEQLSMMLGISRQTTNQILKDLQERQMLRVHRGEVEIVDLHALRTACQ